MTSSFCKAKLSLLFRIKGLFGITRSLNEILCQSSHVSGIKFLYTNENEMKCCFKILPIICKNTISVFSDESITHDTPFKLGSLFFFLNFSIFVKHSYPTIYLHGKDTEKINNVVCYAFFQEYINKYLVTSN